MIFGTHDTGPELPPPMVMVATEMLNLQWRYITSDGHPLQATPSVHYFPSGEQAGPCGVVLAYARQTSGTLDGTGIER